MDAKQEFIRKIAFYVEKYRKQYGIELVSAIVAQSILESGYGTSELATNCNNFFGLKYRPGRCPTAYDKPYDKVGSEQNKDGSYTSSNMQWCKFPSFEAGVRGYFDFINIARYKNLKGVTDYKVYIDLLREDGYWTSLDYHTRLKQKVVDENLVRFDTQDVVTKPSSLIDLEMVSPNRTSPRKNAIDTITIHHTAGVVSAQRIGEIFATKTRGASCNYGVGVDGKVVLVVPESDRSWCSGTGNAKGSNDHRAITLEVSNSSGAPNWEVSNLTLSKTIELVADVCKRNGIEKLVWDNSKENRINHVNGANMTLHKDFQATSCPGPYLEMKMPYIAQEVNKILSGEPQEVVEESFYYTIQRGDTLKKIGDKFGVDYLKIARDNNIANPNLIITGRKLLIKR